MPGTKAKREARRAVIARRGKRPGTKQPPKVQVTGLRHKLGLSQTELARVTGYSLRSIAGWESGKPLSDSARQKMIETDRLTEALGQVLPAGGLAEWMRTPNSAFEGQTPIRVIERGESDRLWRMIVQIDSNVAS